MGLRFDSSKRSFSLVELLVVIAIMAVMMSLLAPSLQHFLYKSKVVTCTMNYKSVGQGFSFYSHDHNDWLPKARSTHSSNYDAVIDGRVHSGSLTQLCWRSNMYDIIFPYFSSTTTNESGYGLTEASFGETFICPQVNNDTFWYVQNGKKAPGYYINDMPLMLYYDVRGYHFTAQKMEKVGEAWNWSAASSPRGATGANEYDYTILASDTLHRLTGKYGTGGLGEIIHGNHKPPGVDGIPSIWFHSWGPYGRAWRMDPVTTTFDSNYLLQDGSVFNFSDIPYTPEDSSPYLRFKDGVYVPAELGTPL